MSHSSHVKVRGQLTSQFSPFTVWILGIKFKLSGLVSRAFTHRAVWLLLLIQFLGGLNVC